MNLGGLVHEQKFSSNRNTEPADSAVGNAGRPHHQYIGHGAGAEPTGLSDVGSFELGVAPIPGEGTHRRPSGLLRGAIRPSGYPLAHQDIFLSY